MEAACQHNRLSNHEQSKELGVMKVIVTNYANYFSIYTNY